MHTAKTWREALEIQAALVGSESEESGDFWEESANACYRAIEIWDEMRPVSGIDDKIAELRAQIVDMEAKFAESVADILAHDERSSSTGWRDVCTAMMDSEIDFEEWLNW